MRSWSFTLSFVGIAARGRGFVYGVLEFPIVVGFVVRGFGVELDMVY